MEKLPNNAPGIQRHRLITGGCVALSLAILSLAMVDLNSLIEKKGTIDKNLKFVPTPQRRLPLDLQYANDEPCTKDGLRRVWNYTENEAGYVDANDKLVLPPVYAHASDFHEGLAAVKYHGEKDKDGVYNDESQKFTYIDKDGKNVLPQIYTAAGDFSDGVAPVVFKASGALIDKTGKVIKTSASHDLPERINNLYKIVDETSQASLVDRTGKTIVPAIYDNIGETGATVDSEGHCRPKVKPPPIPEHFTVWKGNRCGLVDETGQLVLPIKYNAIKSYNRGYGVVEVWSNYGIVDGAGKFLIPAKYQFITMYDDLIAARDHWGHWSVFDSTGKELKIKLDGAIADQTSPWINDGMAPVVVGEKCGYLNSKGEFAIAPLYESAKRFSEGYGLVEQDGMWHYISKSGKVMPAPYALATPLNNGKAEVTIAGSLYNFVNGSNLENHKADSKDARDKFKKGEGEI